MVQLKWDSIWTFNHMHLKELEILRKMISYLRNDKTECTLSCFSGQDMVLNLNFIGSKWYNTLSIYYHSIHVWYWQYIQIKIIQDSKSSASIYLRLIKFMSNLLSGKCCISSICVHSLFISLYRVDEQEVWRLWPSLKAIGAFYFTPFI